MSTSIKHLVEQLMSTKTFMRILLVLILYVGSAGSVSADAEAPILSPGMEWKYSVWLSLASLIGQVEGGFDEMLIEGTIVMTVDSLQTVDILGSSYDAWVIALEGNFDIRFTYDVPEVGPSVMSVPATSEGLLYLDNESYEYVMSSMKITSSFSRFSVTFDLIVELETALRIENDTWLHPFDVDSIGETTGHGSSYAHYVARINDDVVGENETTVSFSSTSAYECLGFRPVSVGAGDFEAYELNVSSAGIYLFGYPQGYRREYYSNEANSSVEVIVYSDDDEMIGKWTLASYGKSQDDLSDWSWALILLLLIIILAVPIVALALRRRSRKLPPEEDASLARRTCRRCGSEIPEGGRKCPSCGRAIW